MDFTSWFRRSSGKKPKNQNQPTKSNQLQEYEEELLGVTDQLLDHLKTFTLDTFKNFPFKGSFFFLFCVYLLNGVLFSFLFFFPCVYRIEFFPFFPLWLNTSFVGDELKGCLNLAYFRGIWCKFEFFISICWIQTLRIGWIWCRWWWSCLWRGSCNKFFRECTEGSLWVAGTPCFSCAFKI